MAAKGGAAVLLLIILHAALAMKPGRNPDSQKLRLKYMSRKLMLKCLEMGYQVPSMKELNKLNGSDYFSIISMEDRMATENGNLFSMFISLLDTLPVQEPDSGSRNPPSPLGPEFIQMWNSTDLPSMMKLMMNVSETSVCFVRGFIAPLSWKILTTRGDRIDEETYGAMSWAARPLLQNMPPSKLNLPPVRQLSHLAKMMRMLKNVFGALSENQRVQVRDWVKEQISQNYFNCTLNARGPRSRSTDQKRKPRPTRFPGGERPTRPAGEERPTRPAGEERPTRPAGEETPTKPMADRCRRNLMWLEMEALKLMGPYLSRLKLRDVKSSSKDQLCEFFKSPQFRPAFRSVAGMSPYLARRFLQRVQECYDSKAEFTQQLDRLGILGCFYKDTQSLNANVSMSLLSQLGDCTNSGVKRLRKRLVKTIMSSGDMDLMGELGASVAILTPKQLSKLPIQALRSSLQALGPDVTWKPKQAKRLAKKLLAGKTEVTSADLMSLGPAVKGVPPSMLKKVTFPKGTRKQDLRDMTKKMTKGQKKALMKGFRKSVKPSELVNQMPDSLLATLPLNILDQANITSLDQVEGKDWSRAQAAHLIKKMMANKVKAGDIRRLGSAMQGLTCKMINRVANSESREMAQAMTDSPQWLSKAQAGCAARKLFVSLEEERADYFQTVTEEELNEIPTILLIRLSPGKIKGLPDSVCTAFLDKMTVANLSSLPPRAPSRPALTNRAVLCLANGGDLSGLSSDEVLALGPLICEVPPAKLRLLDTDTLNSSLQAMASCRHIPPAHRAALVELVKETFGDPSDWSMEIMETLSPFLLLDAATISPLRFKSWLKEVLADLKDSLSRIFLSPPPGVKALKKKIFSLTFGGSGARRKREVRASQGNEPTEEMIEDLEDGNVHWSPEQLQLMTTETFVNSLETLSSIPDFSAEQLAALREKVIEVMGPVAGLNESQLSDLGCVSQCLSDSELRELSMSLDTVEEIAECGWNQSQREAVWAAFANSSQLTASALGDVEIIGLDQFICGLSPSEVSQINPDAFREAMDSLGDVQCPQSVSEEFKKLSLAEYGDPSSWSEAEVLSLGNIIAALSEEELLSLDPSVFSFMVPTSIPLIPAENFAALSVDQLVALGPDNAAMVTSGQMASLGPDKQAALEESLAGARAEPQTAGSGAPSLGTEGIKLFLFLFLGFLLL